MNAMIDKPTKALSKARRRARKGESMERVRACYDGIKTAKQIATELGLGDSYVRDAIKKMGLPVVYHKDDHRRAEYRECAAAGMTYEETAKHLGVDQCSVRKMSSKHGITFRPKLPHGTAPRKKPKPLPPVAFSVSPDAIHRYLERAK